MKHLLPLLAIAAALTSCNTSHHVWKFGPNPHPTRHQVGTDKVMVRADGRFALKQDTNRIVFPDLRPTRRKVEAESLEDLLGAN